MDTNNGNNSNKTRTDLVQETNAISNKKLDTNKTMEIQTLRCNFSSFFFNWVGFGSRTMSKQEKKRDINLDQEPKL